MITPVSTGRCQWHDWLQSTLQQTADCFWWVDLSLDANSNASQRYVVSDDVDWSNTVINEAANPFPSTGGIFTIIIYTLVSDGSLYFPWIRISVNVFHIMYSPAKAGELSHSNQCIITNTVNGTRSVCSRLQLLSYSDGCHGNASWRDTDGLTINGAVPISNKFFSSISHPPLFSLCHSTEQSWNFYYDIASYSVTK